MIFSGYNDSNERYIITPQMVIAVVEKRKASSAEISNTSLLPLLSTLFCVLSKGERSTPDPIRRHDLLR